MSTTEIEWGYNCLTDGVHHGRPEALWNLPLLQSTYMFTPVQLQQLVADRIYNDALQLVEHSPFTEEYKGTKIDYYFTQEWAEKMREVAAPKILPIYQRKVGEITEYYRSPEFKRSLNDAIERNQQGKLNPGYEPLHSHDTLNLLCRIVGQGSRHEASRLINEKTEI